MLNKDRQVEEDYFKEYGYTKRQSWIFGLIFIGIYILYFLILLSPTQFMEDGTFAPDPWLVKIIHYLSNLF
jgi:hypothetical protein